MSITNLISYELLGPKEEFAGWVSNISPYDTPFTSLTGKAKVYNKVFEWQTDSLELVDPSNAWEESREHLPSSARHATTIHNNYTQIFRKVVEVSDTADALAAYGRPSELEYQIEKATKEIKRDLEWTLLSDQDKYDGSGNNTRLMSGFFHLVSDLDEAEPNTGAVTHKRKASAVVTEEDIYDITYNLYLAGARANVVMFHPVHAPLFNTFYETGNRVLIYMNDDEEVPNHLTEFTDPLGQKFTLLPNKYMNKNFIYFFHPHDWFQRVLRNPTVSQLDKTGSNESWMIEIETGLQHRNPWASGILEFFGETPVLNWVNPITDGFVTDVQTAVFSTNTSADLSTVVITSSDPTIAEVSGQTVTFRKDGTVTISASIDFGGFSITAPDLTVESKVPSLNIGVDFDPVNINETQMLKFTSEIDLTNVTITTTSSDDTILLPNGTNLQSFQKLGTATLTSTMTVGDGVVVTSSRDLEVIQITMTAPASGADMGIDTIYNSANIHVTPANYNTGRYRLTINPPTGFVGNTDDYITVTEVLNSDGTYSYIFRTGFYRSDAWSYNVSVYERPSIKTTINVTMNGANNTKLRFNSTIPTGTVAQESSTAVFLQTHTLGTTVSSITYEILPDTSNKTALKVVSQPNTTHPNEPTGLITAKIAESDNGSGVNLINDDYPVTNYLRTIVTYDPVGTNPAVVVELITPITVKKT